MGGGSGIVIILAVSAALLAPAPVLAHPALDEQIADLDSRIENDDQHAELFFRRAEVHRAHRDWDAALADYRRCRELDPQRVALDFSLGRMWVEAGRPAEALTVLGRLLEARPRHADGLLWRARARAALGQTLGAAAEYSAAIDAFPVTRKPPPDAYLERARSLAAAGSGHLTGAIRGLEQGLEALGRPVTLELLALDYEVDLGRHEAALRRVERLRRSSPRPDDWFVREGEILERAGRTADARQAYTAALAAIETLSPGRRRIAGIQAIERRAREALGHQPPPATEATADGAAAPGGARP